MAVGGGAAAEGAWLLFRKTWVGYLAAIAAVPAIITSIMFLGLGFVRELEMTYQEFAYLVGVTSLAIMPFAIACAFLGIRWRHRKLRK